MATARKRLLILGAGDFGREFLWVARDVPASARDWEFGGFLDDNVDGSRVRMLEMGTKADVIGTIRDYRPAPRDVLVCSIAHSRIRLSVCESLRERGAVFASLIHPTAAVAPGAAVGVGVFLYRNVVVSVNARIGDFVQINIASSIGHDAVLGDGCSINSHCDVTGHVTLGRGATMGSHACVLPGIHVGDFATVGAGSVAIRTVAPGATVFGVPAKRLPSSA